MTSIQIPPAGFPRYERKEPLREQIARDVAEFEAGGGVIERLPQQPVRLLIEEDEEC